MGFLEVPKGALGIPLGNAGDQRGAPGIPRCPQALLRPWEPGASPANPPKLAPGSQGPDEPRALRDPQGILLVGSCRGPLGVQRNRRGVTKLAL